METSRIQASAYESHAEVEVAIAKEYRWCVEEGG